MRISQAHWQPLSRHWPYLLSRDVDDMLLEALKTCPFWSWSLLHRVPSRATLARTSKGVCILEEVLEKLKPPLRVKKLLIPEGFLLSSINKMVITFFPVLTLSIFKVVLKFIKYIAEMLIILSINNIQEESHRILIIFHPSLCMPVRDAFSLWLQKTCSTKESISAPLKWVDFKVLWSFQEILIFLPTIIDYIIYCLQKISTRPSVIHMNKESFGAP